MHTWVVVVGTGGRPTPEVGSTLDDRGNPGLRFPPTRHERWSSADGRVQLASWSTAPSSPGAGAYLASRPGGITAFSGWVWHDNAPWAGGRSWADQLADRFEHRDAALDQQQLGGVFTLLHLRDDGTGWITADPLGIALVYVARSDGLTVYSNSSEMAARAVTAPGGRPRRDLEAMGWLAATGSLQDGRTGFEDVEVVPAASIVRIGPRPSVETWSARPWATGDRLEVADAVALAKERLTARVALFAPEAGGRTSCELTGGRDSRMLLALLLATGMAGAVRYVTWGGEDHVDVQVASALARRFDLDLRAAGYPRRRRRPGDGQVRAVATDHRVRELDLEASYRHHVWMTAGGMSLIDLRTPAWPPPVGFNLCGFFGEPLRTNFPSSDRVTTDRALRRYLDGDGFGFDVAQILTPECREHHRRRIESSVLDLVPAGGDVRDGIDAWYLSGRKRQWIGLQHELDARNRAYPLYDLDVIRAAFAIGAAARRREALTKGLVEACAPELAGVPYANEVVGDRGVPWDRLPLPVELALLPLRRRVHRSPHRTVAGLVRRRRAEASVGTLNRLRGLEAKRALLRSFLDVPPDHATWDLYDRRRTLVALDRIEDLPVDGQAQVHHAATVALWLSGGEQRADVFEPAGPPAV